MTPADAIASIPVLIMSSGEGQQICHGAGIAEVDALTSNSTDVYVPKSSSRLTRRIYMYRFARYTKFDSSLSQVLHDAPSSVSEARLYGSPAFGLRQHFTGERKWAVGLQFEII